MEIKKPSVSPPQVPDPGSCQAVRIQSSLEVKAAKSPEPMSREESEANQKAYERERARSDFLYAVRSLFWTITSTTRRTLRR
jgi:hypothetical protein